MKHVRVEYVQYLIKGENPNLDGVYKNAEKCAKALFAYLAADNPPLAFDDENCGLGMSDVDMLIDMSQYLSKQNAKIIEIVDISATEATADVDYLGELTIQEKKEIAEALELKGLNLKNFDIEEVPVDGDSSYFFMSKLERVLK